MLRKKSFIALMVMTITMTFCFVAWSEPSPKQAVTQHKSGKLAMEKSPEQITPPPDFITTQQLIDAITHAIEATADKAKATQNPPPPDDSSRFTLWLVIFTGGLVLVGIVQCYIILNTLRETQIAANAAKDSADVAKQTLIYGQRAFVFVKTFRATEVPHSGFYRITAVLENSGQTQAKYMLNTINCKSFPPEGLPENFDFTDPDKPINAFIGPKATIHSPHIDIPITTLERVSMAIERIFIWGWVDYNDVFDKTPRHRTEFCYEVAYHNGFMAFLGHNKYNGADDECYRKPSPYTPPT